MTEILEVSRLNKIYGNKLNQTNVLADISFSVDRGEFVGIMGPSGAGKTTLLNIMSTIDRPTTGKVLINGTNISKLKEKQLSEFRRQELGFIFQDFNLLDSLSVKDNILLPLAIERLNHQQMLVRLAEITKILEIDHLLSKKPTEISIGQKQRVAAARAVITEPSLVFADEPTGSLDSKSATELLHYLTEMNKREGTTIMMVTHDAFTASYCHRILFIKDGLIFSEIVRQGSRKDFFQKIMDMQTAIGGGVSHELS